MFRFYTDDCWIQKLQLMIISIIVLFDSGNLDLTDSFDL